MLKGWRCISHLRCNLLFGLIGHFGLLKDVNISFFLSLNAWQFLSLLFQKYDDQESKEFLFSHSSEEDVVSLFVKVICMFFVGFDSKSSGTNLPRWDFLLIFWASHPCKHYHLCSFILGK